MDSGDIRTKLQELQARQHQEMMQKVKTKSQKGSSEGTERCIVSSFGLDDDLQLKTSNVSTSSIEGLHTALEDANTRMREQIRELKDETGRLRKQLAEKEYDIRKLNKVLVKMEDDKKLLANAGALSDTAAVKIVDLSKRNRELTAEMEAEKTKSLKLLKRIAALEQSGPNDGPSALSPRKKASPRDTLALHPEAPVVNIDELHDKLQLANIRQTEYRNQIQELKQELKIAHRVLQLETGESAPSMQLLLSSAGTGFRGRAQQITALHDKVKDLEHKLKIASGKAHFSQPDKNHERIRNMEKQRKEQTEELRLEIAQAAEHNSEMQRKLDATKARNKVLLNETKSLKAQIVVLTEKGAHDNELIMTLMRQQEGLQKLVQHNLIAKQKVEQTGMMLSKEVNSKQQQENAEISRLRQLLAERDTKLRRLEEDILVLRETEASRFIDLSIPNPENNSGEHAQQLNILRTELAKYQALYNASLIEEQNHKEMQTVLTRRVEHATTLTQDLNKSLSDERRKCAKLELSIEALKQSGKQHESSPNGKPRVPHQAKISELETLLSIQTDENLALKESLQSTLQAKNEDANLFHEMMEQTKTVFMDALRNLSAKKS